ncbi:PH domain-containing protein [Mycetocola zhujimingii]|nr:PH domain-containing protein [Mycetocola zhujimingii]
MPTSSSEHHSATRLFGEPGDLGLPAQALKYLNLVDCLAISITAAGLGAIAWLVAEPPVREIVLVIIALGLATGLTFEIRMLNRIVVRKTSYTVTRDEVYIARGLLFRKYVSIPAPQVLNVEIAEGPLLRKFGLVKIRFTCITDVEALGPITPAAAESIRSTVLSAHARALHDT